jgi:hypothetical protein
MGNLNGLMTEPGQIWAQYSQLSSEDDPENWSFEISPNWTFIIEDEKDFEDRGSGYAVVGCDLEIKTGQIERYSLTLTILQNKVSAQGAKPGEMNGPLCCGTVSEHDYHIVRRLHFDVDPIDGQNPKPVCHLQVGGKVSPSSRFSSSIGQKPHYCRSNIKKPRVPHPPMDPVLLLDTVFTQYTNLQVNRDDKWIGMVRESEKKLWKPYMSSLGGRYSSEPFNPLTDVVMGRHDEPTL